MVVDGRDITCTIRDPQFVDGDVVNVDGNDRRTINQYVTGRLAVTFPIQLEAGINSYTVSAQSVGVTPPLVVELSLIM